VTPLASTCGSRIRVVVVVALIVVNIGVMIEFGVGVVHEIVGGSGVLFSVVLNRKKRLVKKRREKSKMTYTNVTLDDIVDVARTVLIEFQVMAGAFL
jgi:hypothetical protein